MSKSSLLRSHASVRETTFTSNVWSIPPTSHAGTLIVGWAHRRAATAGRARFDQATSARRSRKSRSFGSTMSGDRRGVMNTPLFGTGGSAWSVVPEGTAIATGGFGSTRSSSGRGLTRPSRPTFINTVLSSTYTGLIVRRQPELLLLQSSVPATGQLPICMAASAEYLMPVTVSKAR